VLRHDVDEPPAQLAQPTRHLDDTQAAGHGVEGVRLFAVMRLFIGWSR
jgi:hypothetical protein